jgi:hypothetical protein
MSTACDRSACCETTRHPYARPEIDWEQPIRVHATIDGQPDAARHYSAEATPHLTSLGDWATVTFTACGTHYSLPFNVYGHSMHPDFNWAVCNVPESERWILRYNSDLPAGHQYSVALPAYRYTSDRHLSTSGEVRWDETDISFATQGAAQTALDLHLGKVLSVAQTPKGRFVKVWQDGHGGSEHLIVLECEQRHFVARRQAPGAELNPCGQWGFPAPNARPFCQVLLKQLDDQLDAIAKTIAENAAPPAPSISLYTYETWPGGFAIVLHDDFRPVIKVMEEGVHAGTANQTRFISWRELAEHCKLSFDGGKTWQPGYPQPGYRSQS